MPILPKTNPKLSTQSPKPNKSRFIPLQNSNSNSHALNKFKQWKNL